MGSGPTQSLFSPGRIGGVELKNRIMFAPIGTGYVNEGHVTDQLLRHYERRAKGGAGLIIVEVAIVNPKGGTPHELMIYDDQFTPGLVKLTDLIKAQGSRCFLQLGHAGAQISSRFTGHQPVGPSAIPDPAVKEMPHELEISEIRSLIDDFSRAATRARAAGFDGIELHGAHGYLIGQFLSPVSNRRSDVYGGDAERRFRFVSELLASIRGAVGPDFPIVFRLSAEEHCPGGLTIEDACDIAKRLEQAGVDALHVSAGRYVSLEWSVPPMSAPRGVLLPYAAAMKAIVNIPVIAVGRLNDPTLADQVLMRGEADFVALGRPLLADPDLPMKVKAGRLEDVRMCTACNDCFVLGFLEQKPIACMVNPELGHEGEFDYSPVQTPRRVVIVGGGPGGLEAARVARLRGHSVILVEAAEQLGGHLRTGSRVESKWELNTLLDFQLREIARRGVEVRTRTMADPELIDRLTPDAVIIAVGGRPSKPDIAGIGLSHVVSADAVLDGRVRVGGPTVIIGGSGTGCEVAEYLLEQGVGEIAMVARGKRYGHSLEPLLRRHVRKHLQEHGVRLILNAEVEEITGTDVCCYSPDQGRLRIPAAAVVVARGYEPINELAAALQGKPYEVYALGDCLEVRKIRHAIREAHMVACQI